MIDIKANLQPISQSAAAFHPPRIPPMVSLLHNLTDFTASLLVFTGLLSGALVLAVTLSAAGL